MKKYVMMLFAAMFASATLMAKDIKVLVVKTTPEMHCNSCETKIKNNIRFVSGVKKVDTNLETKQVTISYDPEKTNAQAITAAFKKIGYETETVSDKAQEKSGKSGDAPADKK